MEYSAKKGDWVQISQVILEPGQRAPQVPHDTSLVPLTQLVKGFLLHDASLGDTVTIETIIGRNMTGKMVEVNPGYKHSFGSPRKEFMKIGSKLREILYGAS